MPALVVVYADFESAIDDKNRYKPIMLSCLAVSRISDIDTQLRVFHAPHENEEELRPFITYLLNLYGTVKRYLFEELPIKDLYEVEKDFRFTTVCPFCHTELGSGETGGDSMKTPKVRQYAHVVGEYTTRKGEARFFKAVEYIFTRYTKCNLQLSFNK